MKANTLQAAVDSANEPVRDPASVAPHMMMPPRSDAGPRQPPVDEEERADALVSILYKDGISANSVGLIGSFVYFDAPQLAWHNRVKRRARFRIEEVFFGKVAAMELDVLEFASRCDDLTSFERAAVFLKRCEHQGRPVMGVASVLPAGDVLATKMLVKGRHIESERGLEADRLALCEPLVWPKGREIWSLGHGLPIPCGLDATCPKAHRPGEIQPRPAP